MTPSIGLAMRIQEDHLEYYSIVNGGVTLAPEELTLYQGRYFVMLHDFDQPTEILMAKDFFAKYRFTVVENQNFFTEISWK